jgi:AcrR family transcriptional regulator
MQDTRSGVAATASRRSPRRRDDLVGAAVRAFAARGVGSTSVDDIVRAAGVAKGTFYLYFATRDDIVTAVAERLVEGIGEQMDEALAAPGRSAADRICGIAGAMTTVGADPSERELLETLHSPGNAAVHDRLAGRIAERLMASVAGVIEDGIATGEFAAQDPRQAAAFVLGCFTSLHDLVGDRADLTDVVTALNAFVLRGLGCRSEAAT